MYLYNVVLGNQNIAPAKWVHMVDDYGNHFIAKDDISQRLRIDKEVDQSKYPPEGELAVEWASANMSCHHLLPGVRWSNNNKNMNPLLLNDRRSVDNPAFEQIVCYLTISSNYKIVRFNTEHRILQTYHRDNQYQGCAIVLDTDSKADTPTIIEVYAYNTKKDEYKKITVAFTDGDKINTVIKNVTNKATIADMREQCNKFKNRYMGFKILTHPGDMITRAWVVSPKYKELIQGRLKNINSSIIIEIAPDELENDPEVLERTLQKLSILKESRIRSFTMCGVQLPLSIIRELRMIYVFNYDIKNDVLSCRKSN